MKKTISVISLAFLMVLICTPVFALATIPVEYNASSRAKQLLSNSGLVYTEEEKNGINKVLNAAALTYVAALFTAVMQLLYYASLVIGMGGRRRG